MKKVLKHPRPAGSRSGAWRSGSRPRHGASGYQVLAKRAKKAEKEKKNGDRKREKAEKELKKVKEELKKERAEKAKKEEELMRAKAEEAEKIERAVVHRLRFLNAPF